LPSEDLHFALPTTTINNQPQQDFVALGELLQRQLNPPHGYSPCREPKTSPTEEITYENKQLYRTNSVAPYPLPKISKNPLGRSSPQPTSAG
jgi:hypothetical protein